VIALAFSALIAIYLLIPNALFRFFLNQFVPVKVFQGSRTEELTRAVVTLVFAFWLAILAVWYLPICRSYPFPFSDNPAQKSSDYIVIASGFYNEAMFKDYGHLFWEALGRTFRRQGRMVCWYYSFCVVFAVLYAWASKHYGRFKQWKPYVKFADRYLLPHISQWHVILTPFTFPDPETTVKADVLMTDDTLYSGEVAEHFVDKEGNLSGIFLKNPRRFDRSQYLKEKDRWGSTRSAKTFWRTIPSAKLYLFADKIVNLNLNYEPPNIEDVKADTVEKYLMRYQNLPFQVTISKRPRNYESFLDRVGREAREKRRRPGD
jgi:hypothetical protein